MASLKGVGHAEFDGEGRVVATEHERFWLVNAYVPNSGATLGRLDDRTSGWDPAFGAFCKVSSRGGGVEATVKLQTAACVRLCRDGVVTPSR